MGWTAGIFPEVFVLDSGKKGPNVVIIGGVHGDETPGIKAYQWMKEGDFLEQHPLRKGKLTIIQGNALAISIQDRFFQTDLNRAYKKTSADFRSSPSYEHLRNTEIRAYLKDCDACLDIHSTSFDVKPMTCSSNTQEHLKLCRALNVPYITTGWGGKTDGWASDEFVDACGGIGITVECGQNDDPAAWEFGKNAVRLFLTALGMIAPFKLPKTQRVSSRHFEVHDTIYPQTLDFQFICPEVEDFPSIAAGEVYALDGERKLTHDQDFILVMPSKAIRIGQEACFLGRELALP